MSNKNSLKEISRDPMNRRFCRKLTLDHNVGILLNFVNLNISKVLGWWGWPFFKMSPTTLWKGEQFISKWLLWILAIWEAYITIPKKMIWNLNSWCSKEGVFHKWYSGPCWLFEVRKARSIITALNFASLVWLCRTLSSAPLPALEEVTSVRSLVIKDSAFP